MPEPQARPTEDSAQPLSGGAPRRVTVIELAAMGLSLLWLGAVAFNYLSSDETEPAGIGAIMSVFLVFLPVALIWIAAVTARTVRGLRVEAQRLQAAVDAMRKTYLEQQQAAAAGGRPAVERKLDEIAAAQRQTDAHLVTFTSRREHEPPRALPPVLPGAVAGDAGDEQPALALGTPAEALQPPLGIADFIRAVNFPDTGEDKEGFRALRLALEDREIARLVRAAQDVLTLLAQDGIYMDDLRPDRARPEIWRRFAQGERGRGIAALGGIRDRSSLALTAARMRADPVFRDAAHHFLRQFDRSFSTFEKAASDQDIAELAETRTARAFMLFGRVAGVFD